MPLYLHNGNLLVVGGALAGSSNCCCGGGGGCLGVSLLFKYQLATPETSVTGANGSHDIYVSIGGYDVDNSSETWYGSWSNPSTHYWISGNCPVTGRGDGRAAILVSAASAVSGSFTVDETRTFSQPSSYSSVLSVSANISGLSANTQVTIGGTTYTTDGTHVLDNTFVKTNSNIYRRTWTFSVSQR